MSEGIKILELLIILLICGGLWFITSTMKDLIIELRKLAEFVFNTYEDDEYDDEDDLNDGEDDEDEEEEDEEEADDEKEEKTRH